MLSLELMNRNTNKNYVAIKKILCYHPNIDMESLYAWDSEDEQSLKPFPYVINWFDRAIKAVDDGRDRDKYKYRVDEKKLTAIYQFAKDMPLLFVPTSLISGDNKKRKRDDTQLK